MYSEGKWGGGGGGGGSGTAKKDQGKGPGGGLADWNSILHLNPLLTASPLPWNGFKGVFLVFYLSLCKRLSSGIMHSIVLKKSS